MKKFNWFTVLLFIVGCEVMGSLGSVFTAPAIPAWYSSLVKPNLNPPNWVFGPVWTTLFALMGVSAYLVWRKGWKKRQVKEAINVFVAQFVFNVFWSFLFFGLHSPLFGLFDIAVMWVLIVITIGKFYKVDNLAGLLLVPYLLWVSFATYLNFMVLVLN